MFATVGMVLAAPALPGGLNIIREHQATQFVARSQSSTDNANDLDAATRVSKRLKAEAQTLERLYSLLPRLHVANLIRAFQDSHLGEVLRAS